MHEFELIRRYFDRRTAAAGVVTGIGDDGAVLSPTFAKHQVQVIDTIVEGVHFLADTDAGDIAYRAVAVNLSDIAAMGAEPRWMTLALTLGDVDDHWVESFAIGLFEAADEYEVALIGGDTTRGPLTTVTISMTGDIDEGVALLRSGAQVGDAIYVTGTVGDAAAGLSILKSGDYDDYLCGRFLRPTPRIQTGRHLRAKASAAIDVSDGLAGDLKKLLAASDVGGTLDIDSLPLSDILRDRFSDAEQRRFALCGGDDYELCFTADPGVVSALPGITRIGDVTDSKGLVCRSEGKIVSVDDSGYRHAI